ncbi:GAF domain-containing protein [Phormidium tenue FACHB-886]|nr:GAF domain-containing protein [Phormidium tenue FACHB-886]
MSRSLSDSPHSAASSSADQADSFALLLHRMTNRIRQSLELPEILTATVAEVRGFLQTDRVKIYQFHPDGTGEVIAESIYNRRLPVLLGHSFPAEDVPQKVREFFLKARQRSIVDVTARQIGMSPLPDGWSDMQDDRQVRALDPCHAEYLSAMGVQSSVVVPIVESDRLWGLLVSHHSKPHQITEGELQVVQAIADQLAIAIAQSNLLQQARFRATQEALINRVATLLHTIPEMQLQQTLEQVVVALQGSGGRLYLSAQGSHQPLQLFTHGRQPTCPETWKLDPPRSADSPRATAQVSPLPLEHHPHWQTWLDLEEPTRENLWAITDLYSAVMPSDLVAVLLTAEIRGILILRLQYQQQTLGYLSVFRREIDVERVWAGRIDRKDSRQHRPRQSFETWRELKQGQAQAWTTAEIELAHALSHHIVVAIHQRSLYLQVCALNKNLERDIQRRKQAEQKLSALNAKLEQRVLERTAEFQQANQELRWQITERERALTERQQAEASLARLSRQNELILNAVGEGIYGLDAYGKITFVNLAAAKMLGYEVSELVGQWMHEVLQHTRADQSLYLLAENPIQLTLQTGNIYAGNDDRFYRRDGSSFPVEYISSPIQEQDNIVGAVVLFKDITVRQQMEQLKDEFVSMVSHELRTPLTSIRSTLGLLASGWLNSDLEKSQRMLEIAFSNTNRLVRLINDVLDVERIKFGKDTLEKQLCNAADLMLQSVDAMRAMAEKAEVNLCITPFSATLWVDPDRIIQTFTNLLSNAIKFSPPHSSVQLTAEQITSPSHPPQIRFCVQDEGIGIPADKLETIFDRFQQVNASSSRSQGGTGLGLTICRGIVQQHDGQIWVESQLGQGSRFYLTLPLVSYE